MWWRHLSSAGFRRTSAGTPHRRNWCLSQSDPSSSAAHRVHQETSLFQSGTGLHLQKTSFSLIYKQFSFTRSNTGVLISDDCKLCVFDFLTVCLCLWLSDMKMMFSTLRWWEAEAGSTISGTRSSVLSTKWWSFTPTTPFPNRVECFCWQNSGWVALNPEYQTDKNHLGTVQKPHRTP